MERASSELVSSENESERVGITLAALVYYPTLVEARSAHGRARSLCVYSPLLDSR